LGDSNPHRKRRPRVEKGIIRGGARGHGGRFRFSIEAAASSALSDPGLPRPGRGTGAAQRVTFSHTDALEKRLRINGAATTYRRIEHDQGYSRSRRGHLCDHPSQQCQESVPGKPRECSSAFTVQRGVNVETSPRAKYNKRCANAAGSPKGRNMISS